MGLAWVVLATLHVLHSPMAPHAPRRAPYVLEYATVPMSRNAALAEFVVRSIERGADGITDRLAGDLFTRRSTAGLLARVGRWAAFDLFVGRYGAALAHEYGHSTRVEESGRSATVVVRPYDGAFFTKAGAPLTPLETMSVFGGGLEGAYVLLDRVEDRIYAGGTAEVGDMTVLLWTAFQSESYVLKTLSEDRLATPARFLTGGARGMIGDPAHYVLGLSAERLSRASLTPDDVARLFPDIQRIARSIRRRSLINLLDYEHATTSIGLVREYMWQGRRQVPVRWLEVGPVSLAPALSYRLSPIGPEARVRTRYKARTAVGDVFVRWTERLTPASSRLVGIGGEFQLPVSSRFEPKVGFDLWRNPDRTTSVRGELGATFSPGSRWTFSATVIGKGRGYVPGYPLQSGRYFSAGAGLRF